MNLRWRNLLGGIAILVFLAVYAWAAIALADFVPDHWLAQLLYFGVVGLAWGIPLFPLLSWMAREGEPRS